MGNALAPYSRRSRNALLQGSEQGSRQENGFFGIRKLSRSDIGRSGTDGNAELDGLRNHLQAKCEETSKLLRLVEELRLSNKEQAAQGKVFRRILAKPPRDWGVEQRLFLLRALCMAKAVSDRDLHALLKGLLNDYELGAVQQVVGDASLGFDLVREYYRVRLMRYTGVNSLSLEEVAALYYRERSSFLGGRILQEYLMNGVKLGAAEGVEQVISGLGSTELAAVTKPTLMGVLRLLIHNGRLSTAASILEKYIKSGGSELWLYFLEPLRTLNEHGLLEGEARELCDRFSPPTSQRAIELLKELYRPVSGQDERVFETFVLGPLLEIAGTKRNLMDIRFSPHQKEVLFSEIRCSLRARRALSLIRLGDGEAYPYPAPLVEGLDPALFDDDNRAFERRWWGSVPPHDVSEALASRVRQAVADCDILGVPSVYRVVRDLPLPHRRYGENRNQRSLIRVFSALGEAIPISDKLLTEERCHRCALDEPFLQELAGIASSVVTVSCWRDLPSKFPVPPGQNILVPSSHSLKAITGSGETRQLYEVYPDLIQCMRQMVGPGSLVLIGAGIIGKIFVDEARQRGAVALDVGSLLDYIVGVKTRTVADVI